MLLDRPLTREKNERGSIVEARGVARGDRAGWTKGWLELREFFQRRIGPWMFVVGDVAVAGFDGDNFALECLAGGGGALLAKQCELILFLAADLEILGNVFSRVPHADLQEWIG